jgi:hypothetical protein
MNSLDDRRVAPKTLHLARPFFFVYCEEDELEQRVVLEVEGHMECWLIETLK